jgi:hypothetical protein
VLSPCNRSQCWRLPSVAWGVIEEPRWEEIVFHAVDCLWVQFDHGQGGQNALTCSVLLVTVG